MTAPAEDLRIAVWDRFPLTITEPDGTTHHNARLVLTRPHFDAPAWAWVWTDTRPEPTLVWSGPWEPELSTPDLRRPWLLVTVDGAWNVERGRGCGCSSPLKRMVPWTPMRRGQL